MTWMLLVKRFLTADMSASIPTIYQSFKISSGNPSAFLAGLQAHVDLYNDPAFTALTMEVWSDKNGAPGRLLATSTTSYAKAALLEVQDYALRQLGFEFPKIPLKAGMLYHATLRASGYTGTDSTNIGWVSSYPKPQYTTGITQTISKAGNYPLELNVFTAEGSG